MTGAEVVAEHVTHAYTADGERVLALDDVSFSVAAGGRLTVVGPSGSGKSTLLALIAGLQPPTSGSIRIGALQVERLSGRALLRMRSETLSVVVQDSRRNLLPYGTAVDNILFARRTRPRQRWSLDPEGLLGALGLDALAEARVDRLSGGERQRVAIAAGLALDPGVLLVDEPTSALDIVTRDAVLGLLERATELGGTTLIAITHDTEVASRLGGVLELRSGRVRP